ncbi:hypothetical protein RJ639_006798 [Escallonia herrerae]|uniref:DUF7026 domain-containing protein n=1 Tax=Escallonia herrerae TaxID=1293975 RepID=A0AA89AUT4_9ASTE|nr:hypothetical protein RJ639_006798 [Escallonia herrerae]
MALRFHLLPPKFLQQPIKVQTHLSPFPCISLLDRNPKIKISCTNSLGDAELALDLTAEVEKMNTHMVQREEAMEKSRQLLFAELCQFLGLGTDEAKKKWKKLDDDGKWVLAKQFVSEWGANFHPLSAKSVKEMVDEHLVGDNPTPTSSPSSSLFPVHFPKHSFRFPKQLAWLVKRLGLLVVIIQCMGDAFRGYTCWSSSSNAWATLLGSVASY